MCADQPPPEPLDPLAAEALAQLEQPPQDRTWLQSATLLAITLIMFAGAGFFSYTPRELALLVGVLFFHEAGHYAGMRLFNYQDVKMFFIPLFGAAVAGRPTSVEGYKEAIVLLLGPVPGILLGAALGVVCMFYDLPLGRSAALMLLAINAFNLLPFLPLDGGRLLHLVLFSRQRHLEAAFRVVTGLLLILGGWALSAWLLAILGFFVLVATGFTFKVSMLAQRLRGPAQAGGEMDLSAKIPREQAAAIIERVRAAFPEMKQAKSLANTVRQVWERMHIRPPGVAASMALLMVHTAFFFGTPVVAVLFQMPTSFVVSRTSPDGVIQQVQEIRVWGRLRQLTALNAAGRPHGRQVQYHADTDKVAVEGSFVDGQLDGVWTFYGQDGQVQSRQFYLNGELLGLDQPPPR